MSAPPTDVLSSPREEAGGVRQRLVLRTALGFDPARWRPGTALRCALGVVVPLVAAAASGHAAWGLLAATGALNAGLASFSGVYRARLRRMLLTSLIMSAVTVLGGLVSPNPFWSALAVALVGGGLSLFGARNATAGTVALQATNVLIILTGLPLTPAQAPVGALLVLAGGLGQTLLLGVIWPLGPHVPERRAVAAAYRSLADFAAALPGDLPGPVPGAAPFQEAWSALAEARALGWRDEHAGLQHALHGAEGLRAELAGLARLEDRGRLGGLARALQGALLHVADGVLRGRGALVDGETLRPLEEETRALAGTGEPERWARLVCGHLRDLGRPPGRESLAGPPASPPRRTLRRWPTPDVLRSPAVRHAGRLALVLGVTTVAYRALGVPHGYWLPLTVAVVLRPDYASTLTRAVGRLAGTLGGVVLAGLVVALLHPSPGALSALVAASAWLVYALFPTGYAVFSLAVTLYVVFSLTASGVPEPTVGGERVLATLLGGVIALGVSRLGPVWQAAGVAGALRAAAQAQVEYLETLAAPGRPRPPGELDAARDRARSARVQAEGVVRAAALEPRWDRAARASAEEALARLEANAAALLALHAQVARHPAEPPDGRTLETVDRTLASARALASRWAGEG